MNVRAGFGVRTTATTVIVLVAFAAATLHALAYAGVTSDDAFISLRYAENLLAGEGLRYNAGREPVEGFSNPLFTLAAAALMAAGVDALVAVKALGLVGLLAAVASAAGLARLAAGAPAAALAAVLVAASPFCAFWSMAGLETTTHAALVAAAVLAVSVELRRSGSRWSPLLCVAVAASRPEGVVLVAALAAIGLLLADDRRAAARAWTLGFAAPAAALLLARWLYYGAFVANTGAAKVFVGPEATRSGLAYLAAFATDGGGFVFAAAVAGAAVCLRRGGAARVVALVASSAVFAQAAFVLLVGRDFMPGFRFLVPVYPLLAVLAAGLAAPLGFARAAPGAAEASSFAQTTAGRRAAVALAMVVVGAAGWVGQSAALERHPLRFWLLRDGAPATLAERLSLAGTPWDAHRRVGAYIRERARPGDVLAVTEAGIIPYYAGIETVDLIGLNDRAIAAGLARAMRADDREAARRAWGEELAARVFARRPRWIVLDGSLSSGLVAFRPRLDVGYWITSHPEFRDYRRATVAWMYRAEDVGTGEDRADVVFVRREQGEP